MLSISNWYLECKREVMTEKCTCFFVKKNDRERLCMARFDARHSGVEKTFGFRVQERKKAPDILSFSFYRRRETNDFLPIDVKKMYQRERCQKFATFRKILLWLFCSRKEKFRLRLNQIVWSNWFYKTIIDNLINLDILM